MAALEDATETLERAMGVVGHLEAVRTTDALRAAYNEVRPKVSELYTSIALDPALYARLTAFANTEEASNLPPTQRRFLDKELRAFRRNGADLSDPDKATLREIDVELSKITTKYAQNVLDETSSFELIVEGRGRPRRPSRERDQGGARLGRIQGPRGVAVHVARAEHHRGVELSRRPIDPRANVACVQHTREHR